MKNLQYKYLIGWVGGKRLLRKKIAEILDTVKFNGYIEPFGGGAWVLFYREKWAELEVYNDLDQRLVNLFNVVKYHPCELARQMCFMLSSRKQFEDSLNSFCITDIQKAARFLYLISRSFGAKGERFGTSKTCSMKSIGGIIERIQQISKRLDKVLIENIDAFELIKQYDTKNQIFYLDPQYTKGEKYQTAKGFKHEELCEILKNIKGKFLLSYDDSELIRKLYKDFNIIKVERLNGMNRSNIKNNYYKEVLIKNF